MILQTVRVEEAVGKILSHDITKVVKGESKGASFKKGHIIKIEDIPALLNLGKENIYILELELTDVHEDTAGVRLGTAVTGPGTNWSGPKESRVNLYAEYEGLLKVNIPVLEAINDLPEVILFTLPNNTVVKKGDMLAGTKVIPLVVPEQTVLTAENICRQAGWVVKVLPFHSHKVCLLYTSPSPRDGLLSRMPSSA